MSDSKSTTRKDAQASTSIGPAWRIGLAVALAVLAVLGLIAILGFGAGSTIVCTRCHASQSSALARSPHKDVECATCHFSSRGSVPSRFDVVARMLPNSLGHVRLEGPGRPVGSGACLQCHAKLLEGGVVSKNGLRIDHSQCAVSSACESCHGQSMHGSSMRLVRGPSMTECVACHVANKAPVECSTCHVGKLTTSLARDPDWARVHGPDWKTMHGTGDLRTCVSCHPVDSCRSCHHIDFPHPANFGPTHGVLAESVGTAACYSCHQGPAYCDGCHGVRMPHPAGFLQRHSKAATSVNDPKCLICHVLDDCVECHTNHVHPGGTKPPVGRNGGV